jgi:hypothetical protein
MRNSIIASLISFHSSQSINISAVGAKTPIVDFSDFQCYLCARYVKNTEPKINETYIQTGKANLVFKHLPNRGTESMAAAIASLMMRYIAHRFFIIHSSTSSFVFVSPKGFFIREMDVWMDLQGHDKEPDSNWQLYHYILKACSTI